MPKKITIIALAIIAIVAVAGAATYIAQQRQEGVEKVRQEEGVVTLPEKSEIDTSDWQTYRNEKYGFEVQYPKNWHIKENLFRRDPLDYEVDFSFNKESPPEFFIAIGDHGTPERIARIFTEIFAEHELDPRFQPTELGGYRAYKLVKPGVNIKVGTYKGSMSYRMYWNLDLTPPEDIEQREIIFNKMLESFKFLE